MKRKARHSSLPLLPTNMFSATLASQSYFHCTHLSFISRLLKFNRICWLKDLIPNRTPIDWRIITHPTYSFIRVGTKKKEKWRIRCRQQLPGWRRSSAFRACSPCMQKVHHYLCMRSSRLPHYWTKEIIVIGRCFLHRSVLDNEGNNLFFIHPFFSHDD